jgi:hypothetical protein
MGKPLHPVIYKDLVIAGAQVQEKLRVLVHTEMRALGMFVPGSRPAQAHQDLELRKTIGKQSLFRCIWDQAAHAPRRVAAL